MKAIVIGGGCAGLSAGHRLQSAGWDVVLLEKEAQVGGRAKTTERNGYLIEHGATQISTGYQAYLKLAELAGLRDEIVPSSNVIGLLRHGRIHEINGTRPFLAAFSGALSFKSKVMMCRAVADLLSLKPPMDVLNLGASNACDTETALAYSQRRLNREIYDVLIDPLIRGYTLNRADNVSVVEWFSSLRNLAGQKMLALSGGIQRLPYALARSLNVQCNAAATAIQRCGNGIEVTFVAESGPLKTISGDACVIATQLPDAMRLAPELNDALSVLADKLIYNRSVVVHLGFSTRTATRAIGVLVGTVEHSQIGLVWLEHNKLPSSVPDDEHSLFSVYFENSGLDSVVPNTDGHFVEIATAFVTKLFPELRGAADLEMVSRWDRAIPNPAPGIYKAIHAMQSLLRADDQLQVAGDYFTCTGQNSAIHWGMAAADNLIQNRKSNRREPSPG